MHSDAKNRNLLTIISISIFIGVWGGVTYLGFVKPIFLPSPIQVLEAIYDLIKKGWLQNAIILSVWRVLTALLLTTIVGIVIGSIMGVSNIADGLLIGVVSGIKSIPVTGLIGLIVLWFSIEEKAKIIFLFMGAVFYMILLVRDAIQNVKKSEYIDVARDLGASNFQLFKKVLLPAATPQIYNAIIVANSLMWTYIVLAEYINGNEEQTGLGYLIYISSRTQDSSKVFGLLIIIALIASLFDYLLKFLKKWFIKWD
jgi:ABC-type nitrate/sulfonate/bicarbonate transport system permease component